MGFFTNTRFSDIFPFLKGSNDRFVSAPFLGFNQIFRPGDASWEQMRGKEFNIYETTGALQIVIGKKAQMKSAGIWKHWKTTSTSPEELFNTPILARLNNPNPLQSSAEYLKQLSIHRDVHGAAYIYALKGSALSTVPDAIWNLLPRLMSIETTGKIYQQTELDGIIKQFVFDKDGKGQQKYKANEILFRRLENPSNPIMPLSPFHALSMEISNIRAAMGYRNVLLRKKGAIGILSNQAKDAEGAIPLTPEEKERIEKQYQQEYGISDKQMQVIVSDASLTWQPINFPTKQLMLFEEVDDNLRRIIDNYGLNDNIFSRAKASTFTNILEGERLAYQDTIIPESDDDAEAMSIYLGLVEDGEFLTLDYSHLPALKDDEVKKSEITKRKAEAFAILLTNGMNEDESLEIVGLDKKPK